MSRADQTCREVTALIDELVDGALDGARARAVRAHTRSCASCAARLEATESLVQAAAGLGSVDAPPDLWRDLSARLDADEARGGRPSPLWWWWHAWQRSIFAGAGALAALAGLLLVWSVGSRRPVLEAMRSLPRAPVSAGVFYDQAVKEVARAEHDYVAAIDELRQVAGEERRRWSAEAARELDQNLAVIDAAIARQREAFRGTPEDPAAADALHASYRKKIDFLQEAIVRGQVE